MTAPPQEHEFTAVDLPQPSAGLGGVLVSANRPPGPSATRAGDDTTGALWWLPTPARAGTTTAVRLAHTPGVHAVTINNGASLHRDLAVAFCAHLASVRAARRLPGAWITAVGQPRVRAGLVRLPHLVRTTDDQATGPDTIVWELLTGHDACRWLGRPLPRMNVEGHLAQLLQLRLAARTGQLPTSPAGKELADLLQHRYLSIRLVYEHPALFTRLFEELP